MASASKPESFKDRELEAETEVAADTGLFTPQSWRLVGLLALAVVIVVLLVGQMMGGNKGSDMIPGTPVAAPQNATP